MFKTFANHYNVMSNAVQTAQDAELGKLFRSYILLWYALIKTVDEETKLTQANLEQRILCKDPTMSLSTA